MTLQNLLIEFFFQLPKDLKYKYTSSNLQSLRTNVSQSQIENQNLSVNAKVKFLTFIGFLVLQIQNRV